MIRYLKIFFLLMLVGECQATSFHYVDESLTGNGLTHDGAAWATAWTNVTQISGVAAGDTNFISGSAIGTSLTYSLPSSWSPACGNAGSKIYYLIGQDVGHNGLAYFKGTGILLAGGCTNIVISGDAGDAGMHFTLSDPANNISSWTEVLPLFTSMSNVRFSYVNVGLMAGGGPNPGGTLFYNNASGTRNVELDHLWMKGNSTTLDGIFEFYNMASTFNGGSVNGYDQTFFIHDCTIFSPNTGNTSNGADGIQAGGDASGITFSNCTMTGFANGYTGTQHQDGFQPVGRSHWDKIINNTYYSMVDAVYLEVSGDGGFYIIANNTAVVTAGLVRPAFNGDVEDSNGSGNEHDVLIANNTINGTLGINSIEMLNKGTTVTLTVSNFIVVNNTYDGGLQLFANSGTYLSKANVLLTHAQMTNEFVSFQNLASNSNFRLTANATNLIAQGTNESSVFTNDKDGLTRQSSGAWDIGAYGFNLNGSANGSLMTIGQIFF